MEFAQLKLPAFARSPGIFSSVAALAVSACAITSEGLEFKPESAGERVAVIFEWRSSDDLSGTMTASLADGRLFSGPYFRITPQTQVDQLDPLWEGWSGSNGWRHWEPQASFVKHSSGKVLTNVRATNGERMRCQLTLLRPSSGLSGGAEGACQFTDGITVDATVRPIEGDGIAVRR